MCVAILGVQPFTVHLMNEILRMSVNRNYIKSNNRASYNYNSHQLEQLFTTSQIGGTFHDKFFNSELKLPTSDIATASYQR